MEIDHRSSVFIGILPDFNGEMSEVQMLYISGQ